VSKEKRESIISYVLKYSQIESQYNSQKTQIKQEVRMFLNSAIQDMLRNEL
jgi:hypothetical protein